MIVLLSLASAFALGTYFVVEWLHEKNSFSIKGPPGIPVLYNLGDLITNKDRLYDFLLENSKLYGQSFSFRVPLVPRIVLTVDPANVEYILRHNFDNYIKGPNLTKKMQDFLGDGIFNANGHQWKIQRQVASHMFTNNGLKEMANVFVKHGLEVVKLLLELPNTKDNSIDLQNLLCRFTLDSIGEIAFGTNFDSLHKEDFPFAQAFNQATYSLDQRFTNPLWQLSWWTDSERKLTESIKLLDEYCYSLIKVRKQDPNLQTNKDLLSQHIRLPPDPELNMDDKFLRDVILNFMIAGRDTTAQTLLWTFYLLSLNPASEEKLIAEIDSTLQGSHPTYENVKSMKYISAVIDETLRLYPAVPVDPKYAVENDTLPSGHFIPKGTTVEWSAWVMGRHPDFWEDPDSFKPERWFGAENNGGKSLPNRVPPFIPFQFGPRLCLGQNMAYLEIKVLLCLILQKMTLRLIPNQTVHYQPTITLSAKNGIFMSVHPRH
jgi:cytochrome P450